MRKKNVMMLMIAVLLAGTVLGGCGNKTSDDTGRGTISEQQQDSSAGAETSKTDLDSTTEDVAQENVFEKIAGESFYFSSGAGAWDTTLVIESDGTFSGTYHDADAGDIGSGYPNGMLYLCEFTGRFTTPEKIDEYTYSMQIKSFKTSQPDGKEEIIDGQKIVYTEKAYGLDSAKDIYIYLPGTPVGRLPEGFLNWVNMALKDTDVVLPFYGLYNVNMEEGFIGPEKKENATNTQNDSQNGTSASKRSESDISSEIQSIENQATAIEDRLENESLDQSTMNKLSAQLYKLWDDELNAIWAKLKTTLDSDAMAQLTKEEKEWISDKDSTIKQVGQEYEGGTMQPMVENLKGAELTKQRVYKLKEYFK